MATFLLGPVQTLGHPFPCLGHEVAREFSIGEHRVFAFGEKWIYADPVPLKPGDIDGVVAWDPGWFRNGSLDGSIEEMDVLRRLAHSAEVPLVSLVCDWYASWRRGFDYSYGLEEAVVASDAIITDMVGAASLRTLNVLKAPEGSLHYRPLVGVRSLLSYGRMPKLGGDRDMVRSVIDTHPHQERTIDVAYIGNVHPTLVPLRAYYLEALQDIVDRHKLTAVIRSDVSADEMEEILLNTKVVFNHSLGSTFNMRVYEAAAAGCCLVTDNFNTQNHEIAQFAKTYYDTHSLEKQLLLFLSNADTRDRHGWLASYWARNHSPARTWQETLDVAAGLLPAATGWRDRQHITPAASRADVAAIRRQD